MACSGLEDFHGGLYFARGRSVDMNVEKGSNQIGILWIDLLG